MFKRLGCRPGVASLQVGWMAAALTMWACSSAIAQGLDGTWTGKGSCGKRDGRGGSADAGATGTIVNNRMSLSFTLPLRSQAWNLEGTIDSSHRIVLRSADRTAPILSGPIRNGQIELESAGDERCRIVLSRTSAPQPRMSAGPPSASGPSAAVPNSSTGSSPAADGARPSGNGERDRFLSRGPAEIAAVQQALYMLGLYNEAVDGTYGPATERAIRAWQRSQGLPATGYVTADESNLLKNQALARTRQEPTRSSAAPPADRKSVVPVIACPSTTQGTDATPRRASSAVEIEVPPEIAAELALYVSYGAPKGILAPRGWKCEDTGGSNGMGPFIAPHSAAGTSNPAKASAEHVKLRVAFGGTSGRCEFANTTGPLFPKGRSLIESVWFADTCGAPYRTRPWDGEQLEYLGDFLVRFVDPPFVAGTGTGSPNEHAIHGIAWMDTGGGGFLSSVVIAARLAPRRRHLVGPILDHFLKSVVQ
jgi:peptidoglycan hydrolase-like protein with peptidoglycan-binding domain